MLVPAKPTLAPGLLAASVPPVCVALSTPVLSAWVGAGGLCALAEASGLFAPLVAVAGLAVLGLLMVVLCHTGSGREVPLAIILGLATLPWTLGLLGAELMVGRMLAALPQLEDAQARVALAAGTGRAMAPRLLGAWTSAVLLAALALGLLVARQVLPRQQHLARGRRDSLGFGSAVAVALCGVALVGALEAHHLFEQLTRLARAPLAERPLLLEDAAAGLARLRPLRWAGVGLLGALGLALFHWRKRRGARQTLEWVGSLALLASVCALLLLDAHPLRFAAQGARQAGLERLVRARPPAPRHAPQLSRKTSQRLTTSPSASTASMTSPSDLRTGSGARAGAASGPEAGDGA